MSKTYKLNGETFEYTGYDDPGQVRISGGAIDNAILLRTIWSALGTIVDEKRFMDFCEESGDKNGWRLKTALTYLGHVVNSTAHHMIKSQQEVVFANTFGQTITVGASSVPQYTCLKHEHISTIISAATGDDGCSMCSRNDVQIRSCPLRKALDHVPGMKERNENAVLSGGCPYWMGGEFGCG